MYRCPDAKNASQNNADSSGIGERGESHHGMFEANTMPRWEVDMEFRVNTCRHADKKRLFHTDVRVVVSCAILDTRAA